MRSSPLDNHCTQIYAESRKMTSKQQRKIKKRKLCLRWSIQLAAEALYIKKKKRGYRSLISEEGTITHWLASYEAVFLQLYPWFFCADNHHHICDKLLLSQPIWWNQWMVKGHTIMFNIDLTNYVIVSNQWKLYL